MTHEQLRLHLLHGVQRHANYDQQLSSADETEGCYSRDVTDIVLHDGDDT